MTFEQLIFKVLPDETIHFRLLHNSSRILASQIRPSLDS